MSQFETDAEHLKILSILFYIKAGLAVFGGLICSIYIILGVVFLAADIPHKAGDPPPELMGGIFAGIGIIAMVFSFVFAFISFLAARSLKQRKRYTFCFVVAALSCLSIPLGTILGVFTIIVLSRETVKQLFNGTVATPPNPENYGWKSS